MYPLLAFSPPQHLIQCIVPRPALTAIEYRTHVPLMKNPELIPKGLLNKLIYYVLNYGSVGEKNKQKKMMERST